MKKILSAAAMFVAASASAPAWAEGMASTHDWTGFFVGADVGYRSDGTHVNIPLYPADFSLHADGITGGIRAGYNHQMGNVVLGVDGSLGISDVSGRQFSGGPVGELYRVEEKNLNGSIGARLGYAVDKFLLFARGGWAFTKLKTQYEPLAGGVQSANANGWTAGAGVEYALTENLSAHAEFRHTDYGHESFVHNGPSTVKYTPSEMLVGVSYKFGS